MTKSNGITFLIFDIFSNNKYNYQNLFIIELNYKKNGLINFSIFIFIISDFHPKFCFM